MDRTGLVAYLTSIAELHFATAKQAQTQREGAEQAVNFANDKNRVLWFYDRFGVWVTLVAMEAVILRDLVPGEDRERVEGFLDEAINELLRRINDETPKEPN